MPFWAARFLRSALFEEAVERYPTKLLHPSIAAAGWPLTVDKDHIPRRP